MTEIRTDPLRGHRVVLTPGREGRPRPRPEPEAPESGRCPFCPGHEAETPPEVAARGREEGSLDSAGWKVRVVPNLYPAFAVHEVVIETPEHQLDWADLPDDQLQLVLEVWQARMAHHHGAAGVGHVQVFKNHGLAAGATRTHPHSQILVLPEVPSALAREHDLFREAGVDGCPICRDLGDSGGARRLEEDDRWVVMAPFAPRGPHELWVVPRGHRPGYLRESRESLASLAPVLSRTCRRLRAGSGIRAYNVGLISQEGSDAAGHWRLEILPRATPLAGFEMATGMILNEVPPEESIRRLREAPMEGSNQPCPCP